MADRKSWTTGKLDANVVNNSFRFRRDCIQVMEINPPSCLWTAVAIFQPRQMVPRGWPRAVGNGSFRVIINACRRQGGRRESATCMSPFSRNEPLRLGDRSGRKAAIRSSWPVSIERTGVPSEIEHV
jgi:hypothetical protein